MTTYSDVIDVDVPVRAMYDQWTQFEEFPQFMDGVESVRQIDDTHLHWEAEIAGVHRDWDAEIVEQEPDRIIAWRSTSGVTSNGTVRFTPVDGQCTRCELELEFEPEGAVEQIGDKLGFVKARVNGDLKRFKEFVESRVLPTGAWRGEVHGGSVERDDSGSL